MHTKIKGTILVSIAIVVILFPLFSFFLQHTLSDKGTLTNMLFAIISIASIGFGLAFSNYEIDELKEKREQIYADKKIPGKLRDKFMLDINITIKNMKPISLFFGWLYVVVAIFLSLGVIVNEVVDSAAIRAILKSASLSILAMLAYTLLLLILDKIRLIKLATSEYDKCWKQIKEVLDGDYTSLLPKK